MTWINHKNNKINYQIYNQFHSIYINIIKNAINIIFELITPNSRNYDHHNDIKNIKFPNLSQNKTQINTKLTPFLYILPKTKLSPYDYIFYFVFYNINLL